MQREYYLDNLKVILTMLVIVFHSALAYQNAVSWPYHSYLGEGISWLRPFLQVVVSFAMGLFFMMSGYFLPGSYDRKGELIFLKDRFIKLGIPLLFGVLVLNPLSILTGSGVIFNSSFSNLTHQYFTSLLFGNNTAFQHLWFIEHLIVYALIYCVIRRLIPVRIAKDSALNEVLLLVSLVLGIALFSTVIRIKYPLGCWVYVFSFLQAEAAHLPQYVILFVIGILAYRKDWFGQFDERIGYIGLVIAAVMAFILFLMPAQTFFQIYYRRTIFTFYESFMGVSMCWGLIVFFRENVGGSSLFARLLSENSYAAYILHLPIVILVQYSLGKYNIGGAEGKFITVSLISVTLTYLLSYVIRKNRWIRRVI